MGEPRNREPSEVSGSKRELLLLLLNEPSNAEKLAGKLRFHVSVVRRHLEEMKGNGLVDATFERRRRGRPNKMYSITVEGRESLDSRYHLLLDLVTEALTKGARKGLAREVFASAARGLARSVQSMATASNIGLFDELGFEPEEKARAGQIVSKNCPVLRVAKKYPELTCDTFHTVLLRELLHSPRIRLKAAISRGARECVHEVSVR